MDAEIGGKRVQLLRELIRPCRHSLLYVRFRGQSGQTRAPLIGRSSLMDACRGESRPAIARTFAIPPTTYWTA